MQYYIRDPESPFYDLMEDTTIEQTLTEEEKIKIQKQGITTRVFTMFEGGDITDHEHNFSLYAFMNKKDCNFVINAILKRSLGLDIDMYEIDKIYSGYRLSSKALNETGKENV